MIRSLETFFSQNKYKLIYKNKTTIEIKGNFKTLLLRVYKYAT